MESKTASSTGSVHGIVDMVRGAVEVSSVHQGDRTAVEWMDVLTEITEAATVLAAARDAALVRLAAIEEVVTEDGVIGEQVNGLGTVSLDAAAMAATATGVTTRFAHDQIKQAVTRAVRVPEIHDAMLAGKLDDYKAKCIASELDEVPIELARTVMTALGDDLTSKSGPALRRRTRDLLFALDPDLLKERIRAARNNVGLRRWTGEPGTENWGGVFPSERGAKAWAGVDALAHQYKADGTYPTLEQARGFALLDLLEGKITVETVLNVTASAEALADAEEAAADDSPTAAPVEDDHDADDPSDESASSSEDSETFLAVGTGRADETTWMPVSALAAARPRVVGAGASWARARGADPGPIARFAHPVTGALVDVDDALATEAYTPGERMRRLIQLRDARCRFPGCVVPARQCDIDHVIPWPVGPTSASNLILLCRRHHRVKQRHRWSVRLFPDGRVEWTDPTGRRIVTDPVDHLRTGCVQAVRVSPATADQIAQMREDEALRDEWDRLDEERRNADGIEPEGTGPPAPWETDDPTATLIDQILDETIADLTRLLDAAGRDAAPDSAAGLTFVERRFGDMVRSELVARREHHRARPRVRYPYPPPFKLDGEFVQRRTRPARPPRGFVTAEDRERLKAAGIEGNIQLRAQAFEALEAHEQARLAAAWDRKVNNAKTCRFDSEFEIARRLGVGGIRYRNRNRKHRKAERRERRQAARIRAQIEAGGPPF